MKEAHKRNRNPKYKRKYRVTNWPEYDRSLRNRGDITLWFSEEAIQAWAPKHNGKQGRPHMCSDLTIETRDETQEYSLHKSYRTKRAVLHQQIGRLGAFRGIN